MSTYRLVVGVVNDPDTMGRVYVSHDDKVITAYCAWNKRSPCNPHPIDQFTLFECMRIINRFTFVRDLIVVGKSFQRMGARIGTITKMCNYLLKIDFVIELKDG